MRYGSKNLDKIQMLDCDWLDNKSKWGGEHHEVTRVIILEVGLIFTKGAAKSKFDSKILYM